MQSHPDYSDNLESYVEKSMGDEEFIDAISDILGMREDDKIVMRENFKLAIDAVGARQFR